VRFNILIIICVAIASAITAPCATAKSLCYEQNFSALTKLKITLLGDRDFFRPDENKSKYYPNLETSVTSFQSALKNLPENWQSPSSGWPVNSVRIEFSENFAPKCRVIYSKSLVFVQYDDLNGFVVQGLSDRLFKIINDAIMLTPTTTSPASKE